MSNNYKGEDRRDYSDTRDIAVRAESQISQHMTDCTAFRESMQNTLKEFREDIKKLNWRIALLLGAIECVGKLADYLLPSLHHITIN